MDRLIKLAGMARSGLSHPADLSYSVSFSRIRWLIVAGLILIGTIACATVIAADNFRTRAIDTNKRELENTVVLLANHFDQRFFDFIAIQQDFISSIQKDQISSPDMFKREMSTLATHDVLRNKVNGTSDAIGVNIFDAEGTLINSSEVWPPPDIRIADRAYFKDLKSETESGHERVEIVRGHFNNQWRLVFARNIVGSNGVFLGLIAKGIDPATFEKFFSSVSLNAGSTIGLYQSDGTLVARYPHVEEMIGTNFSDGPVHRQVLSHTAFGTIQLKSPVDNVERIGSAKRLSAFPMSVIVTTSLDAALADWKQQTVLLATAATLTALAGSIIVYLIVRQLTQQILRSRRQLATALNNMTQGLMLYDSASRAILWNARYIEMYGLSREFVVPGRLFREIMQHRKDAGSFAGDVNQFVDKVLDNVAHKRLTRTVLHNSDGRTFQIVNQPLAEGGWVTTHEDITEQKRLDERITYLAQHDALTDLPNRNVFRERLAKLLDQNADANHTALLYIDIDRFKHINDTLGHQVGDELLKLLAVKLKASVRSSDIVARLGGDEFAIIMPGVNSVPALKCVVEKLLATIREPLDCIGHQIVADASIGVAIAPADGDEIDKLIHNADLAMYEAKSAGRRGYRFFEKAMEAKTTIRRAIEVELREALRRDQFSVYYQPVIDIKSGNICGCEALLRWKHPELGDVSPADFIPIAEDTGLIVDIGDWVLNTACAEALSWPEHIKLAVNVSPVQFSGQTFALKVAAALGKSGLPASRLELEITEAVLIRDDATALLIFEQIQKLGVSLALDDFGTGYSSLSYLHRFPFDKIKIDRRFVGTLNDAKGGGAIVRAVIDIARQLNVITTAEGVETPEQLDALASIGCKQMQGFLVSPALPADKIRLMLFDKLDSVRTAKKSSKSSRRRQA